MTESSKKDLGATSQNSQGILVDLPTKPDLAEVDPKSGEDIKGGAPNIDAGKKVAVDL